MKPTTNSQIKTDPKTYNRQEDEISKDRVENAKHLFLSSDIFLTIQPNNLKYHVCSTCCPQKSIRYNGERIRNYNLKNTL